jgi:hypothetical protein
MTVITTPLNDTAIMINGACSLQTSLSNVTVVAADRIALGPQVACSYSRLLADTFSLSGGTVENSVLWSGHRLYINAGSYKNTQLICEDSIACTTNADFSQPNIWIARGKNVVGTVKGGIWLQGPAGYTGVVIAIDESQPGNRSYLFGIRIDRWSSFTGYGATNSDLYIRDVTLTGKFWAYDVQTKDDAGMLCIQYLLGIRLNRLASPLPFPIVGNTSAAYFIVR